MVVRFNDSIVTPDQSDYERLFSSVAIPEANGRLPVASLRKFAYVHLDFIKLDFMNYYFRPDVMMIERISSVSYE